LLAFNEAAFIGARVPKKNLKVSAAASRQLYSYTSHTAEYYIYIRYACIRLKY
jgi:hypothetical protein